MNKFFVPDEIYEDRIAICKECVYYKKLLGNCSVCKCFMKVKARLAPMACPQSYWLKTTDVIKAPEDLPQHLIEEVLDMWDDLKTGRAKDQASKKLMIETYNTIFNTNYNPSTNCNSCISAAFEGIKIIYEQ